VNGDSIIEPKGDLAVSSRHVVETPTMLVNILGMTDDAKCYEMVRRLRWPDGVHCPHCDSVQVVKQGRDETRATAS
jgi:hypothetical protein